MIVCEINAPAPPDWRNAWAAAQELQAEFDRVELTGFDYGLVVNVMVRGGALRTADVFDLDIAADDMVERARRHHARARMIRGLT